MCGNPHDHRHYHCRCSHCYPADQVFLRRLYDVYVEVVDRQVAEKVLGHHHQEYLDYRYRHRLHLVRVYYYLHSVTEDKDVEDVADEAVMAAL